MSVATSKKRQSYPDAILASAPVGYWRLGERSGTVARDEMGKYHGAYVNTPTLGVNGLIAGDGNTAVSFASASSEDVSFATSPLAAWDAITILGLVSTTEAVSTRYMVASHDGTGNAARFVFGLTAAGGLEYVHNGVTLSAAGPFNDGTRHSVGFTVAANDASVLYADGRARNNGTDASAFSGSLPFRLASLSGSVSWFNGTLDEFAIWSRALSPGEIANLYSIGRG